MKSFKMEAIVEETPKVVQSFQTDAGIVKFLNKVTGQKDHDKDLLINDLILFNSHLSSNHNFISHAVLQDKDQLQELLKILEREKIDITFYESLTLIVVLNFDREEISKILKNNSTSSIRELTDGVESMYENDERNFNLLRDKILLLKTIFYSRIYEKNSKDFFDSINYENSNDKRC